MSIIALLIALLLPSVKRSKANARSVICATNVKQMTLAIRWYSEDFDNVMVTPIDKDPPCCWGGDWYIKLQPYLDTDMSYSPDSAKPFVCPDAEVGSTARLHFGYHLNPHVAGRNVGGTGGDLWVKRDLITYPGKTPVMFDASGLLSAGDNPYESWYGNQPCNDCDMKFRHVGGTSNIAMLDHHVEQMQGTYTGEHSDITGHDTPDVWEHLYDNHNGPPFYWHYLYRPYDLN